MMEVRARAYEESTWPEMDPRIWNKLPEELIERVLSFLPLKSFFGLRSTCKHFKSLIFSPFFLSKHSSGSSSSLSCFLLLSHPQSNRLLLYDTAVNTWRNLTLPISPTLSCAHLLSTSAGLFCFSTPDCSSSIVLYNLLTRTSRSVKFPDHPFSFELLTLVTGPEGYKIFLTSSPSNRAFVYDSKTEIWNRSERAHPPIHSHQKEGVPLEDSDSNSNSLYFVTREPSPGVVRFDLDAGKWERVEIGLASREGEEMTFTRLASSGKGKRLFMFGGIGRNGISRSMKLWEYSTGVWVEVETVPELMCKKFGSVCYHNYEQIYCFWHEGMICVCCYTWPEVLYYKVSRRTWHWLPKSPSLPDKASCGFKYFSFVPQLFPFV